MQKRALIFDHDGGVDDLLSLMLLLTMEHIELLGVSITPADCYLSDATLSTQKLLKLFGREDVPVVQGNLHGVNAFPSEWRAQPKICNALPAMLNIDVSDMQVEQQSAADWIADTLVESAQPITVLMTGPCTNLVAALKAKPNAKSALESLVWMGGAVDVPGNVATHNHNTTAEWNAFWDPYATAELFTQDIDIKLVALDATNHFPVNIDFLQRLAKQVDYPISCLAGQFWATTINTIPSYEFTYFMWDVLATCYLALGEEALSFESIELDASVSEPNAGQTYRQAGNGQWVSVAKQVQKDKVLDYILHQLKR